MTLLNLIQTTPVPPYSSALPRAGYLLEEFENTEIQPDSERILFVLDNEENDPDIFFIKKSELKDWIENKTERLETYALDNLSVNEILSMSFSNTSLYLYERLWLVEEILKELTYFGTNIEQINHNKEAFIQKINEAMKEIDKEKLYSEEEVWSMLGIQTVEDGKKEFEREFDRNLMRIRIESQQKKKQECFRQEWRYLENVRND